MGLRAWLQRLRRVGPSQVTAVTEQSFALPQLEEKLGHTFTDREILRTALTHRSHVYRAGQERVQSNERLEFLGDSILGLIVNEHLYRSFPERSATAKRSRSSTVE